MYSFYIDFIPLFYYFFFVSFLIVIFVYDLKHKLIPDFATAGIALLALVRIVSSASCFMFHVSCFRPLLPDLLATFTILIFFGALWYFSNGKAMGFGDVKLAPVLALFLGASKGILAVLFSFWIGAIVGIVLMLGKKAGWKSEIPFGPFLTLGAFIALLWGEQLIEIYFRIF